MEKLFATFGKKLLQKTHSNTHYLDCAVFYLVYVK
jgi:hypothetical protein